MTVVRLDPLAKRELADAADYYDGQSAGLGDGFLFEVGRALEQLAIAPRSCPVIRGEIRRKALLRFRTRSCTALQDPTCRFSP